MKGDFSRLGFDPGRRFTRVLMQQGRVQLDSDWNERQEIDRYLGRAAIAETLGASGVPAVGGGFAVGLAASGKDLILGSGRLFVEGLLCENDAPGVTLGTQPDLPLARDGLAGLDWPTVTGRYLAFLDVWERDVSALQDPSLRETALGGPDTATRTRLVWQLRLEQAAPDAAAEDFPAGWEPLSLGRPRGRMLAETLPAGEAPGPCTLPPQARYTALSNQLYRVEVHQGGWLGPAPDDAAAGAPTFKWSRENGSVATPVTAVSGQELTVSDLGADDLLGFRPNGVAEILDARMELEGGRGALLRIAAIDTDAGTLTIDPATPVPPLDLSGPVLLRRWDHPAEVAAGVPLAEAPVPLEAGITVAFTPGHYRVGDWWSFAARTAIDAMTGNLLWPGPEGEAIPPQGTPHHHVPLALVDYDAARGLFFLVEDCRTFFVPAAGRLPGLRARWSRDGRLADLAPGQAVRLDAFGRGIMVASGAALDPSSVTPASVRLVADVPVTMDQVVPGSKDTRVVGTQEVALAAEIALVSARRLVITPLPAAQDMLGATLTRRTGGGTQAEFARQFTTADLSGAAARWQVQPDGTLLQAESGAGMLGSFQPGAPALALSLTSADRTVMQAGASFTSQSTGDAGLVFNWRSNADFWVLFHSFYFRTVGFSGAFAVMEFNLVHYVQGQLAGSPPVLGTVPFVRTDTSGRTLAWTTDLDITARSNGLAFGARVTWANGIVDTIPPFSGPAGTVAPPTAFVAGGRIGVMSRAKGDARFTRLQWTTQDDERQTVLPLGASAPVPVRLVVKRALLRTAEEAQAMRGIAPPPALAPEPDLETGFMVTAASGYYGRYGAAGAAGGLPGIGTERL
ncbi:DUF6519 domain-containing protein [Roseomonas populi]|uniref:DUF6519 domain-containing protein n=1 Tax=Roseomonas populi TaxID=3121582 RepID=A0ABT1X3U2_9PROT|nr:DUF6519 domain-containing protein [Roseomonas pecuniae]MCR0982763.1 DUF6519 domain-containing protein [Roseomonas pecuniae]